MYCISYEICHPQTSGARDKNQSLLTLGSLTASGAGLRGSRLSPGGRHTSYSGAKPEEWQLPGLIIPTAEIRSSHNAKLPEAYRDLLVGSSGPIPLAQAGHLAKLTCR